MRSAAILILAVLLSVSPRPALSQTEHEPSYNNQQEDAPTSRPGAQDQEFQSGDERYDLELGEEDRPHNETPQAVKAGDLRLNVQEIKQVQEALQSVNPDVNVSGIWGYDTQQAVKEYQVEHGLPVTGRPDRQTLSKLGVERAGR